MKNKDPIILSLGNINQITHVSGICKSLYNALFIELKENGWWKFH